MRPPIFVVDDEKFITTLFERALTDAGYTVFTYREAEAALAELPSRRPFLVLLDLHLPGMNGLEALGRIRSVSPETEVVMVSGHGTIDVAVEAIKQGAADFLSKPVQLPEVLLRVSRLDENRRLRNEVTSLRRRRRDEFQSLHYHGPSPAMAKLYHTIDQVAKFPNLIALITGASGTGKEMVARHLHYQGPYADGPFVAINCAAIPTELIEAELFGYAPGSFTDARVEGKRGQLEEADHGTLFLDEIGELNAPTQVKLLRFLQDRTFARLGEATETRRVECNIVCATNRDLPAMIVQGTFREDLYYRINVVHLHVPSLAERKEDILFFAESFLQQIRRTLGRRVLDFDETARARLLAHDWPGNLRELRNVIERACLLANKSLLTAGDLLIRGNEIAQKQPLLDALDDPIPLDEAIRLYVKQVIEKTGQNISEAARLLGISRNRLKRIVS